MRSAEETTQHGSLFFFLTSIPHLKLLSHSMTSPRAFSLLANPDTLQKQQPVSGVLLGSARRRGTSRDRAVGQRAAVHVQGCRCTSACVRAGSTAIYSLGPSAFMRQLFWQRSTATAAVPERK